MKLYKLFNNWMKAGYPFYAFADSEKLDMLDVLLRPVPPRRLVVVWDGFRRYSDFVLVARKRLIASKRAQETLLAEKLTGIEAHPVTIRNRPETSKKGYGELWVSPVVRASYELSSVAGKFSHEDFFRTVDGVEEPDEGQGKVWRTPGKGLYIRERALRGLDFFRVLQKSRYVFCSERAKEIIEREKFTGVELLEYGETYSGPEPRRAKKKAREKPEAKEQEVDIPGFEPGRVFPAGQVPPARTRVRTSDGAIVERKEIRFWKDLRGKEIQLDAADEKFTSKHRDIVGEVAEYLRLEGERVRLRQVKFLRSAKVEGSRYLIWRFTSSGEECFATYELTHDGTEIIGYNPNYEGLTAEQFLLAEYFGWK